MVRLFDPVSRSSAPFNSPDEPVSRASTPPVYLSMPLFNALTPDVSSGRDDTRASVPSFSCAAPVPARLTPSVYSRSPFVNVPAPPENVRVLSESFFKFSVIVRLPSDASRIPDSNSSDPSAASATLLPACAILSKTIPV